VTGGGVALSVFDILTKYRGEFLYGLWVTLKLCLLIWPIGVVAGTALGVAGARWKFWVGIPSKTISFTLSGIPILVFLFWLHYPVQSVLGVVINPFYTAAATLSIVNVLLVADLIRGVLNDFPAQYIMAARVCGLTSRQTVLSIQLPIIFRQVLPSLLLIQVSMLQATLFASLISVDEIFRVAQRINSAVYRPVEIYTALAVFFLAVCLPMHGVAYLLKARFTRDLSEQ
jgi:His/Glu/Gln/Arg/opine family amino acid ABC transporter permease subunit